MAHHSKEVFEHIKDLIEKANLGYETIESSKSVFESIKNDHDVVREQADVVAKIAVSIALHFSHIVLPLGAGLILPASAAVIVRRFTKPEDFERGYSPWGNDKLDTYDKMYGSMF